MNKKNRVIVYIPFIAILIFLGVIIYSDYFYLSQPEAWISFFPLLVFLIIFVIIELKKKLIIKESEIS